VDVLVPDLGDFADVEIIEILVKPGDHVAAEDSLLTLETEKAAMDVPCPAAGVIREIVVEVGGTVSPGDRVAVIDVDDEAADAAASADDADSDADAGDGPAAPTRDEGSVSATGAGSDAGTPATEKVTVTVPDVGDFADVEVIEVLVEAGDEVRIEQGLVTLETEKAAMDVPSTAAGRVVEVRVAVGDTVNAGDAIAVVEAAAGSADNAGEAIPDAQTGAEPADSARSGRAESASDRPGREPAAADRRRPRGQTARPQAIDEAGFARAHASPSVRKLARELGVDLTHVAGSGRKGRVTADDVKGFVKSVMLGGAPAAPALPEVPSVDFARFGPVETQPLSRIQKISGPRLHASWVNVPHVTQHDEADITDLEETRQTLKAAAAARDIKLTPLAFVMRACAIALAEFPVVCSSLAPDGASLVLKGYRHIGFAADTPNGLVVPVIRDADKKDVYELAAALATLSARAREGKLKSDEIQGGVFTISSLGGIGGTYFTPIINAPEVAILGVSRHSMKPVFADGSFVPRLMLPLSLSYDHRVIDGALAARFITRLSALLGEPERLVEAIP
jgi:pyruvate dehydrogenase E2 component (dihydrolipoamide acetyltransferase)